MSAPRVCVVGAGIAGLTAAHRLKQRYEVTVLERSDRVGGNAYTYTTRDGDSLDIAVAAFGKRGYRRFFGLLGELGVRTVPRYTSFVSIHDLDRGTGLYVTPTLRGLIAQRFALLRPSRAASLVQTSLGVARLKRLLRAGELDGLTVREALRRAPAFAEVPGVAGDPRRLLLSVLCLLSSMSADEVLDAPATFFVGKLAAHDDVLSPRATYSVHCIAEGTRAYVDALASGVRDRVVLGARVASVSRDEGGVTVHHADGREERFDHLVLACHADEALAMLASPTRDERALLGPWRYKDGRVVVHRDHRAFPPRPLMQAFTFLYRERDGRFDTSVNGALWHEPYARPGCEVISSQHPNFPIQADLIEMETVLRTPIFDAPAVATQPSLGRLNGAQRTYYCGSYFGHGLHEDAVRSALDVAALLGCQGSGA